MTTKAAVKH